MNYATDGICHNAEPGTYGHECSKPAVWLGTTAGGFRSGFCDFCKRNGWEARGMKEWTRLAAPAGIRVKYLCTGWHAYLSPHAVPGAGVWRTNDASRAIVFADEAAAKQFLHDGKHDLNPLQLVFEPIA